MCSVDPTLPVSTYSSIYCTYSSFVLYVHIYLLYVLINTGSSKEFFDCFVDYFTAAEFAWIRRWVGGLLDDMTLT